MKKEITLSNMSTESPKESIWNTFFWLITILLLPQLVLIFLFGLYFEISEQNLSGNKTFELWFTSVSTFLILTLLTPLITFPLLIKATYTKKRISCLHFWAIKPINRKELLKWLLLGGVLWSTNFFIEYWLKIPIEPFMASAKGVMNNHIMVILVFISVCLVAPIIEEIIFRGWFFKRVADSKLGDLGAIVLTSFTFSIVHTQYEHFMSLVMIFILGFALGLVRYKSNNTSYCIAIHILFNTFTTISLF
jgi:membrane protease YdiL (CAAX protease family)